MISQTKTGETALKIFYHKIQAVPKISLENTEKAGSDLSILKHTENGRQRWDYIGPERPSMETNLSH